MKNRLKTLITLACGALMFAGAIGMTGCAGSRYERSTGTTLDDAGITAKVKTDLLRDPMVKGTDVNVDTYRGVVELNGFVNSQQQKQEAENVAQQVEGVRSVKNNLTIKPEAAGSQNQQQNQPQNQPNQ